MPWTARIWNRFLSTAVVVEWVITVEHSRSDSNRNNDRFARTTHQCGQHVPSVNMRLYLRPGLQSNRAAKCDDHEQPVFMEVSSWQTHLAESQDALHRRDGRQSLQKAEETGDIG